MLETPHVFLTQLMKNSKSHDIFTVKRSHALCQFAHSRDSLEESNHRRRTRKGNEMEKNNANKSDWKANNVFQFPSDLKPRANSAPQRQQQLHSNGTRLSGLPAAQGSGETDIDDNAPVQQRKRSASEPVCPSYSKYYFINRSSSRLTEQAKQLSEEEIQALEIDIFKPLDFYEILFDRIKANDSGRIITSLSQLSELHKDTPSD